MGETEISWTHRPGTVGRSWNPGQGCSRVSEGCRNCYAERLAARFHESGWSQGLINPKTKKWNGTVRLAQHKLSEPLRWRQPSTVFVNSMTDLFHEGYTNEEIAAVFGVMAACPQHTFQILTKRARRMREWFEWAGDFGPSTLYGYAEHAIPTDDDQGRMLGFLRMAKAWPLPPLPNVWLGVSVENQEAADERIPELLRTPAAVRFLSCEPLIGPVTLDGGAVTARGHSEDWLRGVNVPRISWVIAGCESGPRARECLVEWLRSLRDQCAAAGVPFFLKQARRDDDDTAPAPVDFVDPIVTASGRRLVPILAAGAGAKVKGGGVVELPYLDGVQHCSFPEVRS